MSNRYITVITMDTGILEEVFVFTGVNRPTQQVVADAEDKFRECVRQVDDATTNEQMEEYLEDGYHDESGGKEVHMVWSAN